MANLLSTSTVLICEDDPSIASLFTDILAEPGRQLVTASDGITAVQRARELVPAVIVLDLDLPKIDGSLVLAQLKADPLTAEIPVVIVSGIVGWLTFLDRRLATSILEKSCAPADLEAAVAEALSGGPRRRPSSWEPQV